MQGVIASKKAFKEISASLRQLPGSAAGLKQWGPCAAALQGILISDDPRFLRQYLARSDLFELICKSLSHGLQLLAADTAGSAAAPTSSMPTPPPQAAAAAAEVPDHLDLGVLTLLGLAIPQCVGLTGDQDSARMLACIDSSGKLLSNTLAAVLLQCSSC
jgi:hypothetical protein